MQKDREQDEPDEDRTPGVPPHQPAKEDRDSETDEDSQESFPSSDPPSTGSPGI